MRDLTPTPNEDFRQAEMAWRLANSFHEFAYPRLVWGLTESMGML